MPAKIISGKQIAADIRQELKAEVSELRRNQIFPKLVVVLVGNHPASESYVKGKIRAAEEIGMESVLIRLEDTISEQELLDKVDELNKDTTVHGILVQLPLPKQISEQRIIEAIAAEKDVDGFHPESVGRMVIGLETFLSCTPQGIIELLQRSDVPIQGKHAVVVGRSNIVGKPVALLLLQKDATVTICHSKTSDLAAITKQADILIAAVGRAEMITRDHVKPGAVVIDVGVNRTEKGLVGDVKFDEVSEIASAITPVPGGVGPMTITMLMANTIESAKRHAR
ncbi:bifunctional methylenetetrahydrofolate dehydrogenase/methenyltetrahydrofolate cyclohydrolase FolD [Shimazuella sp. AN120528]|uniref:bifunctional methylenetetrahydrofolate dehydrogenase/methenyltetrahydrofolate cyclohydrolase FolD n=1 Tax=Shimazuella soli TaxID=1892854 RepID=UPI001F0DD5CA|nr:bifunctional methylenetetrahydrofolate dehydrogenase/methenyltetrahydrofolate cyclohydrolase FolD [Shimazuella soli]MCH5584200.1 bifunctional methylenetetrahydrofolate dehydrogenase/methenyltetrahydrofolate cyclohydrolase FolD [Shimazuella soli]